MQNDEEYGEQPIDVGLGNQRFLGLGAVRCQEKTVARQIIWFVLIVTVANAFAKNNNKKTTTTKKQKKEQKQQQKIQVLVFSSIWTELTTPRGNTVYSLICTAMLFEATCLPSLMGVCPTDCSRLELSPLCLIRMSRRWVFPRVASWLRFVSVLTLTIL